MASAEFITNLGHQLGFDLKKGQLQCLLTLLHYKDLMFVAPTGYGKSIIFQLAPLVLGQCLPSRTAAVVIVSPLLTLIADNIRNMEAVCSKFNLSAIHLTAKTQSLDNAHYIISTPEQLLNSHGRALLESVTDSIKAVFIDECHCITQW